MKFIIAGLGNPGQEYMHTRHNIGFEILDQFAEKAGVSWKPEKHVLLAEARYKGRQLLLIKPQTYMNLSGKAVSYWMQKEKVAAEQILVLTDDLALPLGTLRLKPKGSDGGHNGLKSINETLGMTNYSRLRFGIGNDFPQGRQVEYVLGQWKEEEMPQVKLGILKSVEGIEIFVSQNPGAAMMKVNTD